MLACQGCGNGGPLHAMPPDSSDPTPGAAADSLRTTLVASGLQRPVLLTTAPGDDRAFVLEQAGRIRILGPAGVAPAPFLDITDRVVSGGERGLLGLAFHPDFGANGWFFVDYTGAGGETRIARFQANADRDGADPASETLILRVPQPFSNHNGGMIEFGPDGFLYIALGDGGGAGDPQGNGQDTASLLGKILRIDVDAAEPYGIPPGNPFPVGGGARPEIWAWGLRNPWRFSFDPPGGRIWIGDVGQGRFEEVDGQPLDTAGVNYGWNVMEGPECYADATCDRTGLEPPLLAYDHGEGCSIIGGYVYRGPAPGLRGLYFFSDYCEGFLRSVDASSASPQATEWRSAEPGKVLSFGRDSAGNLYLLTDGGEIWRIEGIAD